MHRAREQDTNIRPPIQQVETRAANKKAGVMRPCLTHRPSFKYLGGLLQSTGYA